MNIYSSFPRPYFGHGRGKRKLKYVLLTMQDMKHETNIVT